MTRRQSAAKLLSKDEARRIAANIVKLPEFLTRRCGLQHLAQLEVDEMNPPASGTRHGFVNLAIG
jgi:hypothetical protein